MKCLYCGKPVENRKYCDRLCYKKDRILGDKNWIYAQHFKEDRFRKQRIKPRIRWGNGNKKIKISETIRRRI